MAAPVGNFVVLTWQEGMVLGTGPPMLPNPPNTLEYTYVTSAINIALAILETEQGRQALTRIALNIDRGRRPGVGGPRWHGPNANALARAQIDVFVQKLRDAFPLVVINHNMTDIDMLAYTPRGTWFGDLADFNPREQAIQLNGSV